MNIKKVIITFLEFFACFILQTVIFPRLAIASIVPNVLIILTVSMAYMHGKKAGIYTGLICGLLMDFIVGGLIGLYGMVYMGIGYLIGFAYKIYYKEDFTMPVLLIGASDFLAGFAFFVFDFMLRNRLNLGFYLKRVILPEVVYTMLVSIILYKILNYLNQKMEKMKKKEE